MAASRLPVEQAWAALPYQGFTSCACGCGRRGYCAGLNSDSRVLLECFESRFRGRPPNMRRRRRQVAA